MVTSSMNGVIPISNQVNFNFGKAFKIMECGQTANCKYFTDYPHDFLWKTHAQNLSSMIF